MKTGTATLLNTQDQFTLLCLVSPHNHMRLKGSYSHLKRKEKKKDEGEILRNQVTWEQGRWCFRRHLLNSSSEHRAVLLSHSNAFWKL